jgi:multiple sugar transport system substrate-binding protein
MKTFSPAVLTLAAALAITACSPKGDAALLDPDRPITVTVWHYYNGNIKVAFDRLVTEFNETVGMDKGIVVDAQSQGDVDQLAIAVFDAANKSIGAAPMPNIFASYPDNAFRVNQILRLVDLGRYFSDEELNEYRRDFWRKAIHHRR